ncbi:nicotinamide riboside kinase 2 [Hetaerina americana]|uniref:nicotinamide riboside kinase 2 n=1 Tax=Hetaerina americana TaxID=62018 RepID=UPI003A7F4AEC
MYQWLVIGISGVTCGGKTSLTFRLRDLLIQHFQSRKQNVSVITMSQDDYFLKLDDPRHILLPSLGHFNWDIPTAVDFNGMYEAVLKVISNPSEVGEKQLLETEIIKQPSTASSLLKGILLIEGFLIFNHRPISSLCHLKYYFLLSRAACLARRVQRTYDPPDVPGYFEQCIWPEHVKHRNELLGKGKVVDKSDSLTMEQVEECMEEERLFSDNINAKCKDETPSGYITETECVESGGTEKFHVSNDSVFNKAFYMRVGGDVLPLTKFGAAGLGMVGNIRVLDGGSFDKELIAQLVFKDVLSEMATHELVNQEVKGINIDK